jgi:superfamily II DNA or RNA helicase
MTQFLPTARVGRIQGQIIDIEDKDIVIGMLQSLSMKEYPATLFHSFGLTIVDECHHISSEVFCRSLQKIMTAYTLGLSATMNRKDGLTKVFKMFLGEIVYSEERENTDQVLVKAIQYEVDNADFNEMCYDYRGNPAYSTMISKLCAFSPRSEFLLQVLTKELATAKEIGLEMQVMILAHNKNLLTYLHDAIQHRGIATVGYYVGGMKEAALKASETCQVIIATYAMASEALDIKTLTTLILATPKTDIVQAVGRILRVKHERPMVIDLIDSHEVFLSQWQKRRKYYTSNQYKIMHTKSGLYESGEWTTSKTAKNTNKSKAGTSTSKASPSTGTSTNKAGTSICKIDVSGLNGTNLLTKGVAAAARLINMNKKEYTDEDEDDSDQDSADEDSDSADEDQRVTIIHSIHELSLKGKCFI